MICIVTLITKAELEHVLPPPPKISLPRKKLAFLALYNFFYLLTYLLAMCLLCCDARLLIDGSGGDLS